ncbi:hypothetical protein SAMN05216553_120131 [Lentzea fradiae]|uniref:DUF3800 domain-containing protein n=2 Tax=Lentzea fradiae TaxID=200378 RepID=A0A1G8BZI2_9PSEU|nr:hypothetical protein SAMN05216553_120131 [Lentzea fradiae]
MFVDESERGGYLMAAVLVTPSALHTTRALMQSLLLPGSRRVHFKTEKPSRRKLVADRLACGDFVAHIYLGRGKSEHVRSKLLPLLVEDALGLGVTRLVLDSRDPVGNSRDRLLIGTRTKAHDAGLVYEHIHSSAEPALWVSDAIAWCHGAGGDWKRRVAPVVAAVADLGTV